MNRAAATPVDDIVEQLAPKRRFRPYPAYRDSCVEWQESVPEHWHGSKVAFVYTRANAGEVIDKGYWGSGSELLFTCAREPLSSDFDNFPRDKRTTSRDLLLTRNGTPYVHLPPSNAIYSNVVQRITLRDGIHRKYAAYALGSACLGMRGYGVSIESLNFEIWKLLRIPLPSMDEQRAIAAFLDRETARIDELVTKKRRLIELLAEKRTALISHAVTKGLNPDAPMKDSDHPWLSGIPAHWSIVAVSWNCDVCNGSTPSRSNPEFWNGDVPWVSSGEVNEWFVRQPSAWITQLALEECSVTMIPKGSVLIGMVGQGRTRGMTARLGIDTCINQNVAAIIPRKGIRPEWLHFALVQAYDPIRHYSRGGQQEALNCRIVGSWRIPLPPPDEQDAIVDYLDREMEKFSQLQAKVSLAVERLREYRSALISAAVTGKIDVREERAGMLLFWRIRYFDSRDQTFKDRDLWLETDTLDPVERAAVEYCAQLNDSGRQREWLRHRHLFREEKLSGDELKARCELRHEMRSFCLTDYFEDERGRELSRKRMAEILTGNPDAIIFPASARQHDVDYELADKRPIPIDQITLSAKDVLVLGYFTRDLRELLSSAFFKEGPGTLRSCGDAVPELHTAVADEEIRSFVTIFRRVYMKKDVGPFLKAVSAFATIVKDHPLGKWVAGVAGQYEKDLEKKPDLARFEGWENWSFTRKRLIDVFLYTQYAHQPDARRTRQYRACLAAVGERQALLTWLFLTAMWECSLHMRNAGVIIADFFDRYCAAHGVACDILMSVARENPGIGSLEKKSQREQRLFKESVARLAERMWQDAERPNGGPVQFEDQGRVRLSAALTGKINARNEAT